MTEQEQQNELALEQAKAARIAAETQLLEKQAEAEAVKQRERTQHENRIIREALNDGPRFHLNSDQVTKLLRDQEHAVEFNQSGATAVLEGKRMPLSEFLEQYALGNPHLVDGRSLRAIEDRRGKADQEKPPAKARSEMSQSEKIAFIGKWGLEAWERLPAFPVRMVPIDQLTLAQFSKLPVSTKTQLIAEHGPDFIEKLARRGR